MHGLHIEVIACEQNNHCQYCGNLMLRHQHIDGKSTPRNAMTKDHLKPRVLGGPTTRDNLVAACAQCNQLRGEIDAVTFTNLIRKWFKRDETLRARWYTLSSVELTKLKCESVWAYERQLRNLAKRRPPYGFLHNEFIYRERRLLSRA